MVLDASYKSKQNETRGKVKVGNNSESLLNEIKQIVYSLYQSKQITKKVYNNLIKSVNV